MHVKPKLLMPKIRNQDPWQTSGDFPGTEPSSKITANPWRETDIFLNVYL